MVYSRRKICTNNSLISLILIILCGVCAMWFITPHDYDWTLYLHQHKIDWLKDFMANSVFELEMIGGGDFAIFFLLIVAIIYFLAWFQEIRYSKPGKRLFDIQLFLHSRPAFRNMLARRRHYAGFIVITTLTGAVFVVHSIKWFLGRARPYKVFAGDMDYSHWYEFGPYFVADGFFRGSFPSGHTATVFTFMALAYLLVSPGNKPIIKLLGRVTGFLSVALSVLMLVSRAMSASHWVSDCLFIIFAYWAVIHIIYHWFYKVPFLEKYVRENNKQFPLPPFYELKISLYLFIVFVCLTVFIVGLRALYLDNAVWLVAFSPVAAIFLYIFLKKIYKNSVSKKMTEKDGHQL